MDVEDARKRRLQPYPHNSPDRNLERLLPALALHVGQARPLKHGEDVRLLALEPLDDPQGHGVRSRQVRKLLLQLKQHGDVCCKRRSLALLRRDAKHRTERREENHLSLEARVLLRDEGRLDEDCHNLLKRHIQLVHRLVACNHLGHHPQNGILLRRHVTLPPPLLHRPRQQLPVPVPHLIPPQMLVVDVCPQGLRQRHPPKPLEIPGLDLWILAPYRSQ
mmetsp:Transcript_2612/g.6616  ORF Transcript_2612/g.6616 Transcript_2612/m.6616 type:complete len:220 (-) Transcript_2612:646-1305(-)